MAISKDMVAEYATAVDISDTDHNVKAAAIYVGVTGTVKVTTTKGNVISFIAVPAGSILPVMVKVVWKVGTDADSMVALS